METNTVQSLNLLLIEDNPDDAELLQEMLSFAEWASWSVHWCQRLKDAPPIQFQSPDLILLDLALPDVSGLETVRRARSMFLNLPIIVLTGLDDKSIAIESMREGAQDYLVKGQVTEDIIERSIYYAIERSKLIETLRILNNTLEERVAQRTQELQNANFKLQVEIEHRKQVEERLRVALDTEKQLNEMRRQFVTNMSHEIRTPLTIIESSASILHRYGEQLSDDEKDRKLEHIMKQVQQMADIVDKILTTRQSDAGFLTFSPQLLNLKILCQSLINDFRLAATGQLLLFESHGDCADAMMDEHLLLHIITNLLSNAIKYSPNDEQIMVRLHCANGEAVLQVEDHGIGIPESAQPHIFNDFHRANNVGTIGGTGLGLAIVQDAVLLHNGSIEFVSIVDVGTTFTVRLPLVPPAADDESPEVER